MIVLSDSKIAQKGDPASEIWDDGLEFAERMSRTHELLKHEYGDRAVESETVLSERFELQP